MIAENNCPEPFKAASPGPPGPSGAVAQEQLGNESSLPGHLLKLADHYLAHRAIHQAMAIFFELVEDHPDTSEASQARQQLMEISEQYEKEGRLHQARSIYERLL